MPPTAAKVELVNEAMLVLDADVLAEVDVAAPGVGYQRSVERRVEALELADQEGARVESIVARS